MKGRGATDKNPTLVDPKKKIKILRFGLSNYKSKLTCVTGTQSILSTLVRLRPLKFLYHDVLISA